ncbi:MAG TPA: lysine-sensitive aspartokinase 3 [Gemmatimonadales bacterium]|nr:lysine-sensitive aspartokinase 3 [Gemmatimonadales bacterium]
MIVCKFGGTSVADGAAIRRLVAIVAARSGQQPLVVVSALAGVTDDLLDLAAAVPAGDAAAVHRALSELVRRHEAVAIELPGAEPAVGTVRADAEALRSSLTAALGRRLRPAEIDHLAGHGELWSSRLVAGALAGAGLPSVWTDIRPIMVTDDRFGRATPYVQVLNNRARECLAPLLQDDMIPVTQGFIGATAEAVPTTLGRGGSDFTAALLGAALGARRVEIWTDVDGLMTADPRIVPTARTLSAASYEEAAELATFGAKVLHPATAMPLVRAGIPIVVLNSANPGLPGTTIEPAAELERMGDSPIRSISWKPGITVINVRAPRMLGAYGFLRAMFEVFERHEVVVDVLASGEVSVSLTVEDRARLEPVVRELSDLGEVWTEDGRAIVSVVGIGLRHTPGLASRIFGAVQPANVEVISQGASAINITFVVREEDGPDVVRRLHGEFFGAA